MVVYQANGDPNAKTPATQLPAKPVVLRLMDHVPEAVQHEVLTAMVLVSKAALRMELA